ncbi:transcription initiation factor TFIID subunit 1 isoform X2 [Daucus carota subsp. sativus]|uniref:transcription initiation factor TFIID subunit 1 isoform X2 n=1 Tax=Daucus carota subsp. sativus TaxID=79200 RepID=UPI0007EF2449|nr:PREDICTED: transcription initiation factor TFIID subunit 1 isoform X2 [Daucus carota subsp. sativus]
MGLEQGSCSTSQDARDEDDEDEYEEAEGGNRLLGFMFGNVDGAGDLDIDYLDEEAKEHLGALADKLGSSLTDINLSVRSVQTSADAIEQDYDEKAEDAVDYEDIEEQYEGPEVQAITEEDYLLPKKDYISSQASAPVKGTTSLFDDENYDEEESEKETEADENNAEVQTTNLSGDSDNHAVLSQVEDLRGDIVNGASETEEPTPSLEDFLKEEDDILEELVDNQNMTPLPILYTEDGAVILRFSEIFGIHKSSKKSEKRECRYSVPKDKYMSMGTADVLEDDDETFFKGLCQGFTWKCRTHVNDDILPIKDNESDLETLQYVQHPGIVASVVDEDRRDTCLSDEPMKKDIAIDPFLEKITPLSPELYLLEQQDWEDRIIWDNSPELSDRFAETLEISGHDSGASFVENLESNIEEQHNHQELRMETDETSNAIFQRSYPVSVEPFGSRKISDLVSSARQFHPQLLRLESRLENGLDNGKDSSTTEEVGHRDAIRSYNKVSLLNKDLLEGSWLDNVIWEPHQSMTKPKLILDLQDEQMLFEILNDKDGKHLKRHAGAMIITRSVKFNGDLVETNGHGTLLGESFNIANDKFYSNRKSSQQLKSHSKKRTAHGVKVLHSIPGLKLQTMKAKLSNKDIANFHRPKALWYPHDNEVVLKEQGKLPTQGSMKIILKSLGGKGSKLHVDAEETIASVKAKASKKLDFKPSEAVKIFYCGVELDDDKSLALQNVRPNSLLHLVRTKIHMLPRAQKVPGENKSLRPPGAFKRKADLSVKDGHVFLMEYCEERPLLIGNVGMGARLCTYYQKSSTGDQTGTSLRSGSSGLGNLLTLDPSDKSPFLGDIRASCSQSCIETNMYRAPIFQHKVSSTDFLLVRSPKGKLSIRRIDRIDVVGQQEPHIEVMSPSSKGVQMYTMNRLLVYLYREFRAAEKRGLRPSIRVDELSAQFPNMNEAFLRKRLKHCADFQKQSNGLFWVMRRNFRIPLEEQLRRMVTPEDVCSYESMQAGLYRLKRLGITRLTSPTGLSSAMNQLPDEAIALAAASHIERELQITPWNLSSNFVACTNQDRENIERLEITGVGDPSGRGLGFSYVRTAPKAPISNAVVKKKAAVSRVSSTVTGTDADLRRLSMEAAREVLLKFNIPEEQIAKLTRWHRIAMIRKLSSEQAAAGVKVDPTTISKYARGQRMSFLQLQQQTREKCQEIWDRQVESLAAVDGEENESDVEANSDLDSFAGDLENLLDAEEFEEGEERNYESKQNNADGVKGLKMRRHPSQAQAEEEFEDEAAEAAELCRMLMDDEEAERKKKKKIRMVGQQLRQAQGSHGFDSVERVKKTNAGFKQHTPAIQPRITPKDSFNMDMKQDERFPDRKNFSTKLKAKKKNEIEHLGFLKKVKILGEGIKTLKEKKSARDSFVCGACGQLGHMRTNKNCPKYGEDPETQPETRDTEKASGKLNSLDKTAVSQQRPLLKKNTPKSMAKILLAETPEEDKSSSKAKILKVKCSSTDKLLDKATPATSQISDMPLTSDTDTASRPTVKVNKIIFANKTRPEDTQVEQHKPSIVIKPPVETDREQPRKKLIIKRPKEHIDNDQISQEESTDLDSRKTKKIIELSSFEDYREQDSSVHFAEASRRRNRDNNRMWEEEQKMRDAERKREERIRRFQEEQAIKLEEQERVANIRRYEEVIRIEREEEELQKANKKKQKSKRTDLRDDYMDDFPPRRIDRRIPGRERTAKRQSVFESARYGAEHAPPTKRRRGGGGEVGLANILENIVEILKEKIEISYLFLKPVLRKEAPDYHRIVKRPMDLSTIKEKVRNLEYKSRRDFRHDMWQITYNAHLYNDRRNPGIPPLADQLLELCDYLLAENDASLTDAEAGIESG